MYEKISQKDKDILRGLAEKQRHVAESSKMKETMKKWILHGDCMADSPMVTIEFGSFENEVLPCRMQTESESAREIEKQLWENIIPHTEFGDDTPVNPFFSICHSTYFKPFDLDIQIEYAENSIGHHVIPKINDLKEDFYKIKKSVFGVEKESAYQYMEYIDGIFGDILPAKLTGTALYSVPTQNIIHVMSMETMFTAICDYPDLFKQTMQHLSDDYLEYFKLLSKQDVLLPTAGSEILGNGTYCFTSQLPDKKYSDKPFTSHDIWGFADSQETVCISPDMFDEFIFPYYRKITDQYGLLSYGCCEGIHPFWEKSLSKLSNLRKISISPWCDEKYMGRQLAGKNIIYHRKPNPNYLSDPNGLDEDAVHEHIRATLKYAEGCKIEFTQRDVCTIQHDIYRVKRYVDIIRDEIDKHYKP